MSRKKTAKKMEKKQRYPNRYPFNMCHFLGRNINITHSYDYVIKTWRSPPPRQCRSQHQHPTLVEIHMSDYERVESSYNDDVVKDPYDPSQKMSFCQVIKSKGVLYAMSLQGSVVILNKKENGGYKIGRIGGNRCVPSKGCRQFREYLVESDLESDGQIYAVFLVSKKSLDVVDDVEVFRLDTEKLLWMEEGNIGDNVFCLEDGDGVRFEENETGFKKNCIYFKHHRIDEWLVFDMETRLILPFLKVKLQTLNDLNSTS